MVVAARLGHRPADEGRHADQGRLHHHDDSVVGAVPAVSHPRGADRRVLVFHDEQAVRRRRGSDAVRQGACKAGAGRQEQGDVQRCRGRGRGKGRAAGDR